MEPITTTLLTALIAGATTAAGQVVSQVIKDAYNGFKQLVIHKLGGKADVANAVQQVEADPKSKGRQLMLQEEMDKAIADDPTAAHDAELSAKAQELLALLQKQGLSTATTVQITQTGSGGLAYGPGAKAAGERGVVADTIQGSVATGDNARQIQTSHYVEHQTNTGGGAAVAGNVDTQGGDLIGRDQKVEP